MKPATHRRPYPPAWKMPATVRASTLWIAGLLWLSGGVWLLLHYFLATDTEFGAQPNRWEPFAVHAHGLLAVAGVFLLGWLTSSHISKTWRLQRNRLSGIALGSAAGVLVLSGYALYYVVNDQARHGIGLLHQALGVAAGLIALMHWRRPRRLPPP